MTRTPLSRSKGQGHQAALVGCSSQANMDMQLVTDPSACMMYIVSPLARGGGILWRPPAQLVIIVICRLAGNMPFRVTMTCIAIVPHIMMTRRFSPGAVSRESIEQGSIWGVLRVKTPQNPVLCFQNSDQYRRFSRNGTRQSVTYRKS